jgi:hypothetical protein
MWNPGDTAQLYLPATTRAIKGKTVTNGWDNNGREAGNNGRDAVEQNSNQGLNGTKPPKNTQTSRHRRKQAVHRHYNDTLTGGHFNNTAGLPFCTVERGPLLFALPLEVGAQQGGYNFAIDCRAAAMSVEFNGLRDPSTSTDSPSAPFDWPLKAPITITARASRIVWPNPWMLPAYPIPDNQTSGRAVNLTLVPYGSTKVERISMFPYLAK